MKPEDNNPTEEILDGAENIQNTGAAASAGVSADPLEEWKNRVAYLSAEIDNMRKRFIREKTDVVRYANEELLKQMIPVLDNLQLALKAARDAEGKMSEGSAEPNSLLGKLLQGVDMVVKHFEQSLERVGVQPIVSVGQTFDPGKHEAIAQSENNQLKDGEVSSELQRGYMLNGRLIRPARVVVNKATSN